MVPCSPQIEYSLEWASYVVKEFDERHPRATEFARWFLGIGPRIPVVWLAKNQDLWNKYKKFVKIMEKWENKNPGLLQDCKDKDFIRDAVVMIYKRCGGSRDI